MLCVHPLQCVRSRHQKAECNLCTDNCPTGAINLIGPAEIDADMCIECGLCAAVCPTGVFESSGPANAELMAWIEELARTTATIAFACPRFPEGDAPGVIRVPCLGRLDASVLVGAAAAGIHRIEFMDSECLGCPYEIGHSIAEQACTESNVLLQAFGIIPCITFVSENSLLEKSTSNSTQIVRVAVPACSESAHETEMLIKKGELPVLLPAKRLLLLSSLSRLAKPAGNLSVDTKLWAAVTIEENCTGCQMCAFFCPAGALVKVEENGTPGLAFTLAKCVNCRLCLEICYMASIKLATCVEMDKVIAQASEVVWSNTQMSSYEEKLKRLLTYR